MTVRCLACGGAPLQRDDRLIPRIRGRQRRRWMRGIGLRWHRLHMSLHSHHHRQSEGGSMICWEYQTQVIINTDHIPSRQVGLRFQNSLYTTRLSTPGSTMNKINPINLLQPFENITSTHRNFRATNYNLGHFFLNFDRPLFPSSFPQHFSGRTNDIVGKPCIKRMWRVNQRDNLSHRRRRFRNVS
jgi:hypothetical protein